MGFIYIIFGITCQSQIVGSDKVKFSKPKLRLWSFLLGFACNHISGVAFASGWVYQLVMQLLLFWKGLSKASVLSSLDIILE